MNSSLPHRAAAACTIIARNYVAHARALTDSYLEHEPGGTFYLFVVDGLPPGIEFHPGVRVLGPADVPIEYFREMAFKYDVTEFCTAVKPSLLRFILFELHEDTVVYFDPDITVFRELKELWEALSGSDIVLIPHLLDPIPTDGKLPSEQTILAAGAYNLGFIALKKSDETMRLLTWWQERLRDDCRVDVANGLFVDQKWIDLAPSLFPHTTILRDDTYDVAYWNLHTRHLECVGKQILVNGRPLAFFHFSGYDASKPRELSKHQNRITVVDGTPLAHLLDSYSKQVQRRGFALTRQQPYGYACFENGIRITAIHRHLYQSLDESFRDRLGDPFNTHDRESFFLWSVTPPSAADLSPFLERLLAERPDVVPAMPDPRGRDRENFLSWAMREVSDGMGCDPSLADVEYWRRSDSRRPPLLDATATSQHPSVGVNICGYLRNETGLGAIARGFIGALRGNGVPVGLEDISDLSPNRSEHPTLGDVGSGTPYDINLVCVNADQHFEVKSHLGEDFFRDRYNIGVWFWELPTFPEEWRNRFDEYDEIWATSSFIATTLAPISPIPIVHVPPVLTSPSRPSREAGRKRVGSNENDFLFLFTFDFASYFERKNPLAVIEAFNRAFIAEDRAMLAIKCVNEHLDQPAFDRLREAARGQRVSIHAGYWRWDEMRDLVAACDAYVSLHRSEGLGLTIADAMALGKPVIATAWSGNVDFMTPANSFPVSYQLVQLEQDFGPYRAGCVWAEPCVAEASRYMRLVYENRELAEARGATAKRDLERDYSSQRVGEFINERLAVIVAQRMHNSRTSHAFRPTQRENSNHVQPPVVPSLDLERSSHGAFGVLAKRGVSLLLSYHTHHQWEINTSFATFMQKLDARLVDQDRQVTQLHGLVAWRNTAELRLKALETDLEAARAETERASSAIARLAGLVDRLDDAFAARPYMADDVYGALGDLEKPMGFGLDAQDARWTQSREPEFEDLFRGSREFIAERQAVYLPFFEGMQHVVDLGSGRGEFLDLLRDRGIEAVGLDLNEALVRSCRDRGLKAEVADGLDYLQHLPDQSLDAIFSAQFIEHIESYRLHDLFELARAKLRPKGLFIAETVNPESYRALKTFHVDLTHQRPIYPQVLLHLCQRAKFASARIFYPMCGGFTQTSYTEAGEYAIVALR